MSGRGAAWAELLRVSALFTVPGDAVAGAAAVGRAPHRGTVLAAASSLCLYEAGMALNDWADRETDAVERPERPLPSGRISPAAALAAAGFLTAAGLCLAARAGRPTLLTGTALAAAVWTYDLRLNGTPAAPFGMAAARALDVLHSATATALPPGGRRPLVEGAGSGGAGAGRTAGAGTGVLAGTGGVTRTGAGSAAGPPPGAGRTPFGPVAVAAGAMAAHTFAVTAVSRREAVGGAPGVPLAALGAVAGIAAALGRAGTPVSVAASATYAALAARPLAHAALNPSPPLLQRAVGASMRAMIPLQAALTARTAVTRTRTSGPVPEKRAARTAEAAAVAVLALLPVARRLSRKVSPT